MKRKYLKGWMSLGLLGLVAGTSLMAPSFTMAGVSTRVVICHRGKTLIVDQTLLQKYLDQGATAGACVVTECRSN